MLLLSKRVVSLQKVLESSRIQPNYRITLTKEIRRRLKVKVGDIIVYVEDEKGNIILKKGELKPL
jgi:bifunctional DNA-binding transcriptional regulator/antitoxin component of YhaV-PrlF toxin-antitoxin module